MNHGSARSRLAAAQRRVSMTDRALAEKSGVSRSTIERLKRGERSELQLGTIERLARALGCSAAWLAYGLGITRAELRAGDALVVRVSLDDCSSAELERFLADLHRAAPGRPVVVLLKNELEVMPEEVARVLRAAQEAALDDFTGGSSPPDPPAAAAATARGTHRGRSASARR